MKFILFSGNLLEMIQTANFPFTLGVETKLLFCTSWEEWDAALIEENGSNVTQKLRDLLFLPQINEMWEAQCGRRAERAREG